LLFPEPQFYEISLNVREVGCQQSLVAADVVPVSLATLTRLEKRHLGPPCYSYIYSRIRIKMASNYREGIR
jgi:hypothetical protein